MSTGDKALLRKLSHGQVRYEYQPFLISISGKKCDLTASTAALVLLPDIVL